MHFSHLHIPLPQAVSAQGQWDTGIGVLLPVGSGALAVAGTFPAGVCSLSTAQPDEETPAEPVSIPLLLMKPSRGRQGGIFLNQHSCMDFVFAGVEGGYLLSGCCRVFFLMDLWDLQIPDFKGSCGVFSFVF